MTTVKESVAHGHYVTGANLAHKFGDVYRFAFGCPMVATFNVRTDTPITDYPPTRSPEHPDGGKANLWLVKVNGFHAWAYRSPETRQTPNVWELVSKRPLPHALKDGERLRLEVMTRWDSAAISKWADAHYVNSWHQTFPWAPRKSADSDMLWSTLEPHASWAGASVLDFGCGWGYHSLRASQLGASVVGVDLALGCAREINDHIAMQDVAFMDEDPGGDVDVALYLSVHHQLDTTYENLGARLAEFRERAGVVFVELILPPMFGTPDRVQAATADAEKLLEYTHRIRGRRAVYRFQR